MASSLEEDYDKSTSCDSDEMWVPWFVGQGENKGLIEVDMSFIEDQFNLYSLGEMVKDFERSWEVIKDEKPSKSPSNEAVLYYLIHQRFILTKAGLEKMADKVAARVYGACSRVACKGFPYVPVGTSDFPGEDTVKMFCYQCSELYVPSGSMRDMDGCVFGRTFAHLLTIVRPDLFARRPAETYVPRVFGFQIYNPSTAA